MEKQIKIIKVGYDFRINNEKILLIETVKDNVYFKEDYYNFLEEKHPNYLSKIINAFNVSYVNTKMYANKIIIKYLILLMFVWAIVIAPIIINELTNSDLLLQLSLGTIVTLLLYTSGTKRVARKYNSELEESFDLNKSKEDILEELKIMEDQLSFINRNQNLICKIEYINVIDREKEKLNLML